MQYLLYSLIVILLLICCLCFLNKDIVHDNIKSIILIVIIILYLRKNEYFSNKLYYLDNMSNLKTNPEIFSSNTSVFKSLDTNEIKDNGSIFYEPDLNSFDKNLKKNKYYDDRRLFIFDKAKCRPECCPSTYSCDRGCICPDDN